MAVGAFAVSAALLRPLVGRIGDEHGRKVLVLGGGFIAGVSVLGYTLATNLPVLIGMRLLTGVGEAAMFVGAATAVQDLSPSARRGEATSYFSIAVYGGLAIGPLLGETVRTQWGMHAVWFVAAACASCRGHRRGSDANGAARHRCRRAWSDSRRLLIRRRCGLA